MREFFHLLTALHHPGEKPSWLSIALLILIPGTLFLALGRLPANTWTLAADAHLILVFATALLLGLLIHRMQRRPRELLREAEQRASALAQAQAALKREMGARSAAEQEVQRSHALLDAAFEHMPVMIVVKRISDLRVVRANRLCKQLLGHDRESLQGHNLEDLFPADMAARFIETDLKAIHDRELVDLPEERIDLANGETRWLHIRKQVLNDASGNPEYLLVMGEDIGKSKASEIRMQQLNRAFAVLSETNQAIVNIRDSAKLVERACEVLVEKGGFPLAWIGLRDSASRRISWTIKGSPRDFAHQAIERLTEDNCNVAGHGADLPMAQFCENLSCCDPALAEEGKRLGLASLAVLPLIVNGASVGSLGIFGSQVDLFNDQERRVLTDLAQDLSHALEAIEQGGRRESAEKSLRLAAQVFENTSEGIMITDADQKIVMINSIFTTVTGYTSEEAIGRSPSLLSSGQHDAAFYRDMWHTLQSTGRWSGEVVNRRKNGEIYAERLTLGAVMDESGAVSNYVAVFSDLTSRKKTEQELDFLSNYDHLTSLPNRRLFADRLDQAAAAIRRKGGHLALFYLDPDRLKTINDTLGHAAGDELLRMMADRIGQQLRASDTLARLNGDVFAILASEITEETHAAVLAEKVMETLRQPFQVGHNEIFINSSIGISLYPTDTGDLKTLHQHADTALHRAKHQGGNTFQFFTRDMNRLMLHRLQLESNLRHALERNEFELHYQPQMRLHCGKISGAEVLLRWHSPELGLVSPAEFIHLAEETGLIVPIGKWILHTVCAQAMAWQRQGQAPMRFAVNLSARQFRDGSLVETVIDALSSSGLAPEMLELELTESIIMEKTEQTMATLTLLNQMGIQVSIDDFCTGYSSLSYLKRLPIQVLKIDQSFVRDIDTDADDRAIVSAIVALAHSLELRVIAEGVEKVEQLDYLREIACDEVQGYHFSKPLHTADFHEFVTGRELVVH